MNVNENILNKILRKQVKVYSRNEKFLTFGNSIRVIHTNRTHI